MNLKLTDKSNATKIKLNIEFMFRFKSSQISNYKNIKQIHNYSMCYARDWTG